MSDQEFIAFATSELVKMNIINENDVLEMSKKNKSKNSNGDENNSNN